MIPDNVTLIVKAPNQQIEDQNIECQSSWTIGQLKGHLSEVYPSKPSTDEQKIIYSGQLLDDGAILKDVLRTYESQIAHIMHLVCTPKRRMATEQQNNVGLRKRTVIRNPPVVETPERPVETASRPETRQNDQNHTVEMQNYLTSFVNNYGRVPPYPNYNLGEGYLPVANDPASIANHMMMMQQAYLQYMQQYANMWQAGAAPPAGPLAEAPPAPAPAPPAEPEEAGRDWLDHLYAASRLAVLLSLVYLYGSPARLLLVLLLAAAGYLHQIGFFRDLHVNPAQVERRNERPENQNQNQPNANLNQPNVNQQPNANQNQPNVNQNQPNVNQNQPNVNLNQPNVNQNQPAQDQNQPNQNQNQETQEVMDNRNNQSLLAVTWMIFTSFFASLIPDTN